MKEITIKIIYDNCKGNNDLQEGWGFSALIEVGLRKILFDTGNDRNAFLFNTEKMGIDPREITDVIFSHKHADHVAGCKEILGKLREGCRVFLPKGFPSKLIPQNVNVQKVSDFQEVDAGIFCMVLKGGFLLYEQALVVQTEKGLVIVTGCAHPGIINIIETAQKKFKAPLHLVLGGFHLFRENKGAIDAIVSRFQSLQVQKVAPCHCSGEVTMGRFQDTYGQDFYKIGTGSVLTI